MYSPITAPQNELDSSNPQLQEHLKQQKVLASLITGIRDALELETMFQTILTQVRELLQADRVILFQFNSDSDRTGEVICEDVINPWESAITTTKLDFIAEQSLIHYQQGQVEAIADIHQAELTENQIAVLEPMQIQASLGVPLLRNQELWGILSIHQCSQTRTWTESDIEFVQSLADYLIVALQQADHLKQVKRQSTKLTQIAQRDQVITEIIDKIRSPLNLAVFFQTVTDDIRQLFDADRVAIFQFNPDWSGEFVAESFAEGWTPLVGVQPVVEDTYLQQTQGGRYVNGETLTVNDIYQSQLSDCHIQLLEQFEAKAFITAPILQGDRLWGIIAVYQNRSTRIWRVDEIEMTTQIGHQIGIALRHHETLSIAEYKAEQQKALTGVITRIRKSWDLGTIFQTTVTELRQLLKVDRVGIFRFDPDHNWEGELIYEDVVQGWVSGLEKKVYDHCFSEDFAPLYQEGRINAIDDIYQHHFQDCYLQVLEQFQVRANLVAPLLRDDQLWGLLCIHHCQDPRHWQDSELEFTRQIAEQLSVALNQDLYYQQVQTQAIKLAEANEREKSIERQKLLSVTIDKIRQSLDLKTIFKSTTQAVRELLKVERVAIYQFNSDWTGKFVADSFKDGWTPVINPQPVSETLDSATENHDELPRNETFVPISQGDKLWGLLVAYQNSQPRYWKEEEVNLLAQVAVQLGIGIQQAELLEKTQCQKAELAQALEELKRTQTRLIQGEKMASLGQLVSGVAHEINNPVSFIYGNLIHLNDYVEVIVNLMNAYQEHYPTPPTEIQEQVEENDLEFILEDLPKTLNSMKVGAERIRKIVLSLRNFSRKNESDLKAVNLHEGLDNTLLILGNRFKNNGDFPGVQLIKKYGDLPLIECFPAQLNQVFMNVISNSIDALEDKFKKLRQQYEDSATDIPEIPLSIWIQTQLKGNIVQVQIKDNAFGMVENIRQRIFDPFFTTKEVGRGTGLGLSISYQIIVEKHRGQIQCFSKPNQGTEFLIEIPTQLKS